MTDALIPVSLVLVGKSPRLLTGLVALSVWAACPWDAPHSSLRPVQTSGHLGHICLHTSAGLSTSVLPQTSWEEHPQLVLKSKHNPCITSQWLHESVVQLF